MLRFGMGEGLIPTRPLVLRVTYKETEHYALTLSQVKRLDGHTWNNPGLQGAADCLLFQCFTGLAYADLKQFDFRIHLKVNNLEEMIQLKRTKSPAVGKSYECRVPLLPAAKRILEKYDCQLPVLSNQKYNAWLHILGEFLECDFKLTSHIGRKTFCTVLFNLGLDIHQIGEWVGHHTAKTTLGTYVRGETSAMSRQVMNLQYRT